MNSSQNPPDNTKPIHFVGEAGVPYDPAHSTDPWERWLELMEVVEELCPRWPERERRAGGVFRL